jgi:hypothetical protein
VKQRGDETKEKETAVGEVGAEGAEGLSPCRALDNWTGHEQRGR